MAKVVNTDKLADGNILARDVYINSSVLYQSGTYITPALIADLLDRGVSEVTVKNDSAASYRDSHNRQITPHQLRALTERFQNDMKSIANELRCGRILHSETSYQWLRSVYIQLFANPSVLLLMDSLKQWDPVCYTHSIDVFVFCSLYSRKYGQTFPDGFILGSLLHDIGKLYTPRSILLKSGKLTEREYVRITKHTTDGFALLKKLDFPEEACKIVRSHHERMDGSGYPDKRVLKRGETELKFMMIADVYSALTLKRSYREPMLAIKALQIILASCVRPQQFDLQTCFGFINFVHIFPPATHVLLTNGEQGIIVPNPKGSDILPKVRLQNSGSVIQMPSDLSVTVKKVTGWDNSQIEIQKKQIWSDFISYLVDGNPIKSMECLDTLSDSKRVEDIFTDLFEKALVEIETGLSAGCYLKSDFLIAVQSLMRLLSWKVLKIARDLQTVMGKVIVVNLDPAHDPIRLRMVNDLFKINGWKTYYLGEPTSYEIISELISRKKAQYLALPMMNDSQSFQLRKLIQHVRSDFPEMIVFVHGKEAGLVSDCSSHSVLTSANLTEFIGNLRYCFPIDSTADTGV
ncbi:HD domain-containing protein [Sporolactobacillus shoreae]|uniref:HD domain-containing protein n=1 Tax=Sporolactobacillus shoreae TaxID=1465501 RepID=A0A4Z0GMN6_9BACL|nr:HD domain-containing phosphohydrolase [Sporolactobacillus shoreae]TGA97541.1 HD domain-containing protein [Sporolactobacillus shoreae]